MGKSNFEKILDQYDYDLPESFIAQVPVSPRDSAKLLIYNKETQKTSIDTFKNLVRFLPKNSVLVFNQTKVIPARLTLSKPTGGKVSILFIAQEGKNIRVLANKKLEKDLTLKLNNTISFTVLEKQDNEYILTPSFPVSNLFKILDQFGETPIPPYIKHTTLSEKNLRQEYQTVFAKEKGSVAAPTASLHFTNKLMEKIKKSGHPIYFVTLHVNLGTFAKLTEEHVKAKKLHEEYYEIDKKISDNLNKAKAENKTIIAVGTTVVRTLESAVNSQGQLEHLSGTTDLFITEGFKLKFVDHIITNFHVPKSSLLMLVSAFIPRDILFKLYKTARKNNFRFFSFGDGMLIRKN